MATGELNIAQLATSAISATDFIAKANSSGLATKNTIQALSNFIASSGVLAFRGVLLAADATVTQDGIYVAGNSGTYTNNGGLVVSVTDQIVLISVTETQTVFEQAIFPISLIIDPVPTKGSANAVQSEGVLDYVENKTTITLTGNVSLTKNDDNQVITIANDSSLVMFDVLGGFRFIKSGTYTLTQNKALVLSSTEVGYTRPDFNVEGTGQILYPQILASYADINDKYLLGIYWNGWTSRFDVLNNTQIYKTNNQFTITKPITVSNVSESNLTLSFTSALILNLENGSFYTISGNSITVTNSTNSVIALSTSNSSYEPLDINSTWSGTVYLYEFTSWQSVKDQDRAIILGSPNGTNDFISNSQNLKVINEDLNVTKTNNQFTITKPINVSNVTNSNLDLSFSSALILNLENGSFYTISNNSLTVTNSINSVIALSTSNSAYEPLVLSENWSGTVYLYEFTSWQDVKNQEHVIVLGSPNGTDNFVSNSQNLQVLKTETETEKYQRFEKLGILPPIPFSPSPLSLTLLDKIKQKQNDVTIVLLGDSISTNGDYTTASTDAPYSPPRMDEDFWVKKLERDLRWKGQKYRRYDAKTEVGGMTNVFTETSTTAESKLTDLAWDWQPPNNTTIFYNVPTRVLDGTNCSVSFTIPSGNRQASFIYRTDYLNAPNAVVSVSAGNSKVKVKESDGSLIEANGYSYSAQETDTIITEPQGDLRKSVAQKRLTFVIEDISSDITFTITNNGSGRLNYWGIEYTPFEFMFRFINVARGGHNIQRIESFEDWDVDSHKPDAIILQCQIINELAKSDPSNTYNTTSVFADRFNTYVNRLKGKSYAPEVIPLVMYIGFQADIVDQSTGEYVAGEISGGVTDEIVDVYKYIGKLEQVLTTNLGYFINLFNKFNEIAYRKAEIEETYNIWTSAINSSGKTGDTFTVDTVHFNNYGGEIAYRLSKQYLNI